MTAPPDAAAELELNQKTLAHWLGLVPRSIHNLVQDGLPNELRNGKRVYPWPACLRWYIDYKVRAEMRKGQDGDEDNKELRRRERIARTEQAETDAEMARIELARERALFIAVDDSAALVEQVLSVLNAGLGNFAGRWAPELVGVDATQAMRAKLETAIDELRASLVAAADERLAAGLGGDDAPDAEAGDGDGRAAA